MSGSSSAYNNNNNNNKYTNDDIKSSKIVDEMKEEEIMEQGELYSPYHALQINTQNNDNDNNNKPQNDNPNLDKEHRRHNNNNINNNNNNNQEAKKNSSSSSSMVGKGVGIVEIKYKMSMVKERLMEKLAAASVPSDALENAKHYCEGVIKDVTSAAQGLTMEPLQRIKSHLADLLPSLSPSLTSKMVDDSEKEATNRETAEDEGKEIKIESENNQEPKGKAYASPASSFFSIYLLKPSSKL